MMKNLAETQVRLVNRNRSIPLHDNACLHTANRMQLKILKLDLETVFSGTDLLPTNYHLILNSENFLQGKISNSQKAVVNAFRAFIGSRSSGFYAKDINE